MQKLFFFFQQKAVLLDTMLKCNISITNDISFEHFGPELRGCGFESGPEVIKPFSCSTQLSIKFFLLINVKIPTIVGILTFMSNKC